MQAASLKKNFGHNCKLPSENLLVNLLPGHKLSIYLTRLYHQLFMISDNNHRTKIFCRSQYNLEREIVDHVDNYVFTIHPTSRFRVFWECFMILVDIISLTYLPWVFGFLLRANDLPTDFEVTIRFFITFCTVTDIVLNFITGYYDAGNEINNDYRKIAKNYIKGRFFFDFVSSFCATNFNVENLTDPVIVCFCFLSLLFRIFRMVNFVTYTRNTAEVFCIGAVTYRLLNLFFFMIILIHWSSCFLIMLGVYDSGMNYANRVPVKKSWFTHHGLWNSSKLRIYTIALYRSTCFLSGSEHNNLIVSKSGYQKNFQLVKISYWIIARALFAAFVSIILQIVRIGYSAKLNYRKKIHNILWFSEQKQLSDNLRSRIRAYYKFKYNNSLTKEEDILRDISLRMKQDILTGHRMQLMQQIQFLNALPENILLTCCSRFVEQIYLPGDVIIKSGTKFDNLHLILTGTVAVYTKSGIEIKHISDGAYIGEVELFSREALSTFTLVALEPCLIFLLHRKDFLKTVAAISQFPEHMQDLQFHIDDYIRNNRFTQLQYQQWLYELKETTKDIYKENDE